MFFSLRRTFTSGTSSISTIPCAGWSFLRSIESRSWKRLLLFGLLLAFQVIAFEPLLFLCVAFLLGALALIHLLQSDNRSASVRRILRTGVVGGVFALALAAIQIFPTLELIPLCVRGAGYDHSASSAWSMHPADLVSLGVSNLFGSPYTVNSSHYWGERFHESREPHLVSFFVGSSALLLANLLLSALISDADVDYVSEVEEYVARNGPREPFRRESIVLSLFTGRARFMRA